MSRTVRLDGGAHFHSPEDLIRSRVILASQSFLSRKVARFTQKSASVLDAREGLCLSQRFHPSYP
jgi:hypothetical protein